ncbi:hypothetical protein AK812_SmicGene36569 [Symbiodinium microadriaticum]|uniref:Uncharacterized protein n=1 Tax=Symbiodinium microadriaticum TaxID=2951 RepID=A0A1Q9CIL9_SYMMI|nr:hypothetical protein AK812_SmicGene36569 [Symbiodinium microadriaticum]
MIDGVEEYVLETADDDDEESFMTSLCPTDMFLTEKSVRSEIKLKDLSSEERKKFEASMAKEWSSWEKFNAVEDLLLAVARREAHESTLRELEAELHLTIKRGPVPIYAVEAFSGSIFRVCAAPFQRKSGWRRVHPNVATRDLDQDAEPQDKRVRILIAQVREMISECWQMFPTNENCESKHSRKAARQERAEVVRTDAAEAARGVLPVRLGKNSQGVAEAWEEDEEETAGWVNPVCPGNLAVENSGSSLFEREGAKGRD